MKLLTKNFSIIIFSHDHEKLAQWYNKILGFKITETIDMPNERFISFDFGKLYFSIGEHDKVKGKSKDPYRIMIGFDVKSVTKTYAELSKKGVTFIAKPFEAPPGGYWCTTAKDPEGNILQFFGSK